MYIANFCKISFIIPIYFKNSKARWRRLFSFKINKGHLTRPLFVLIL